MVAHLHGYGNFEGDGRLPTHGRHYQMARYELPVKEVERKVGKRTLTDIVVGDQEKLAYVHKWTGKRVEFSRPRLDNMAAYLEEADAKWQCELAIAEANTREKKSCIVGFIDLNTVRTNEKIVARVGRRIAHASPMVDPRLPHASRVNTHTSTCTTPCSSGTNTPRSVSTAHAAASPI